MYVSCDGQLFREWIEDLGELGRWCGKVWCGI